MLNKKILSCHSLCKPVPTGQVLSWICLPWKWQTNCIYSPLAHLWRHLSNRLIHTAEIEDHFILFFWNYQQKNIAPLKKAAKSQLNLRYERGSLMHCTELSRLLQFLRTITEVPIEKWGISTKSTFSCCKSNGTDEVMSCFKVSVG